ncbi:MAG: cell wall hydrolase [Clostridia bacterium]
MKRWFCLLLAALLLPCAAAAADYDPKQNYLDILFRAACCGDRDAGRAAAVCYNEWLDDRNSLAARLDFDELLWLAKLIEHEAGGSGIDLEWRMCVGEVVLNRAASPEFPDSIEEVIFQPGQYAGVDSTAFRDLLDPDAASVEAALRLLQGDRLMEPSVVFQANFRQGGGEYLNFYDPAYGYTYFCLSSHPEYYL